MDRQTDLSSVQKVNEGCGDYLIILKLFKKVSVIVKNYSKNYNYSKKLKCYLVTFDFQLNIAKYSFLLPKLRVSK